MSKTILIKPVVSEKAELLSEASQGQYTFVVNKSANKIEIRNASSPAPLGLGSMYETRLIDAVDVVLKATSTV